VPVARQTKLIRLEGEFNHAGVYRAQSGETIRQLIALAGGTTRRADKAQIFVLRADGSAAGQTGGSWVSAVE
jgi:protein involved in polysaccharide export with SLBB domain